MLYGDEKGWTPVTRRDHETWMRRLAEFLETRNLDFTRDGCRAFLAALKNGEPDAGCIRKMSPASRDHAWISHSFVHLPAGLDRNPAGAPRTPLVG